jgi:hypothetical protein
LLVEVGNSNKLGVITRLVAVIRKKSCLVRVGKGHPLGEIKILVDHFAELRYGVGPLLRNR